MAQTALAHTRSQSFSSWEVSGPEAEFTFAVDALRITQLGTLYPEKTGLPELLSQHLKDTFSAEQSVVACEVSFMPPVQSGQNIYRVRGRIMCSKDILETRTHIDIGAFFAISPTHVHLARMSGELGGGDVILREGHSRFVLKSGGGGNTLAGYVAIGFHHVLSGLDHLVFLVGLALVARRPRLAVLCITGFTLGHTASLGLATYGVISPDGRLVEALIGFTIAVMALEAAAPEGARRRYVFLAFAALALFVALLPVSGKSVAAFGLCLAVYVAASGFVPGGTARKLLPVLTAAFGVIHGAGFAGGLQDLSLSQSNLAKPLVGFNIGVELAQLLALAVIYALMLGVSRKVFKARAPLEHMVCLAIFGLGCFWFAQRLWA